MDVLEDIEDYLELGRVNYTSYIEACDMNVIQVGVFLDSMDLFFVCICKIAAAVGAIFYGSVLECLLSALGIYR